MFLSAKSSENLPSAGSDLYSGRSHEDLSRIGRCHLSAPFLSRDAILVQYMLLLCVCPYVCLSVRPSVYHILALYQNSQT